MSGKAIGDIIPEHFRNCGASLGLEFPYIFAHDLRQWIIWHRHSGYIVHVESDEENPAVAEHNCYIRCSELNGLDPHKVDGEVLAAIDATP